MEISFHRRLQNQGYIPPHKRLPLLRRFSYLFVRYKKTFIKLKGALQVSFLMRKRGGDMAKGLTLKQQYFADYYIENGNATQAAIQAGYSPKTAKSIGAENLTKPNIRKYMDSRLEALASERLADQEEILQFLTSVVRGEETEEIIRTTDDGRQTIDVLQVGVKDRIRAAELLGKRYGLWTERVRMEGDIGVTIVDDVYES